MLALCIWGAYLAAGAYLLNMDARKAYIVLACVAAFLGLWAIVIVGLARKKALASPSSPSETAVVTGDSTWNTACVGSTAVAIGGWLVSAIVSTGTFVSTHGATLAFILLACLFCSSVLGVIGLSNPRHSRGKTACMISLISLPILLVVSTLVWPSG